MSNGVTYEWPRSSSLRGNYTKIRVKTAPADSSTDIAIRVTCKATTLRERVTESDAGLHGYQVGMIMPEFGLGVCVCVRRSQHRFLGLRYRLVDK